MSESASDPEANGGFPELRRKADRVVESARHLARQSTRQRNDALYCIAAGLRANAERILTANAQDVESARADGRSDAFVDRLALDTERLRSVASGVEEVADLKDPIGSLDRQWTRPNGLKVGRHRIPLGVIGMIYEARPNVTADATALCLKSGNGVILKGGSDAQRTNRAIVDAMQNALAESRMDDDATDSVAFVDTTERESVRYMLGLDDAIDVVIPRGGSSLIEVVSEHARMPVIKHDAGVCHIVVDGSADPDAVDNIILDAKTSRPAVCNAVETILFLKSAVGSHLERTLESLDEAGVAMHLDDTAMSTATESDVNLEHVQPADDSSFRTEFLDLEVAVGVTDDLQAASDHIDTFGSNHTEAILTEDYTQARQFTTQVDSSVVLVNASTRFSDGGELGLGAEVGISTTRMHAYGPMGLKELTTTNFVVTGHGQTRHDPSDRQT
jgi:glutamate-5-semialdehyde dehydrogenase